MSSHKDLNLLKRNHDGFWKGTSYLTRLSYSCMHVFKNAYQENDSADVTYHRVSQLWKLDILTVKATILLLYQLSCFNCYGNPTFIP